MRIPRRVAGVETLATPRALLVAAVASLAAVAPVPVSGGTGFADAAPLVPGASTDTIAAGATQWYRVELADGQRLELAVTVTGPLDEGDEEDEGEGDTGEGGQLQVALYSPLQAPVAALPAGAELDGDGAATLMTRTEVVGDGPAATAPGSWYASVAIVERPSEEGEAAPAPPPERSVTLDVTVDQTRPVTTTVLQGLTTTTSTGGADAAAPEGADDGRAFSVGPPLGVAAGGLAVGALGGVAVARRRSRRPAS